MKVLIGAAVAAVFLSAAAAAQTTPTAETTAATTVAPSSCPAAPEAPTLPDGATATIGEMQAGATVYEAWRVSVQANLNCRHDEAVALRDAADARAAEYNAANQAAQASVTAWQAATETYNALHPPRRRGR